MRFYLDQIVKDACINAVWYETRLRASVFDPEAVRFIDELSASGHAWRVVDVLPQQRIIYVAVPKAASSRIRATLSEIAGKRVLSLKPSRLGKFGNPPTLRNIGVGAFYRLARNPSTLRFSFVRNPYDRLVSAWADKFQNRPLVASKRLTRGTPELDKYLVERRRIDDKLPVGADRTLSFADFVTYATAVAGRGIDIHLLQQSRILDLPGLQLDYIGRTETFGKDILRLLDHVNAGAKLRESSMERRHLSQRARTADYYSQDLADRVYRNYEQDFDRFGYPRTLPD